MAAYVVNNPDAAPRHRALKWALLAAAVFFILIAACFGTLVAYQRANAGVIFPGVTIGSRPVGGLTPAAALEQLKQLDQQLHNTGVSFSYQNRTISVTPIVISVADPDLAKELLVFDWRRTVDEAMAVGRGGNWLEDIWQQLRLRLAGYRVSVRYSLNRDELLATLRTNFSEFEQPPENAKLVIEVDGFQVLPEQAGRLFNYDQAVAQLAADIEDLEFRPITLALEPVEPAIKKENTGSVVNSLERILARQALTVTADGQRWQISRDELVSWLEFQTASRELTIGLNKEKVGAFFEPIATAVNVEGRDAKFQLEGERVVAFQASQDGKALNVERSYELLNQYAVAGDADELALVVEVAPASVETDDLNNLGIKELLGRGTSNFAGSPKNRRHNIGVGVASLNGILIKPDEEFSLLKALGSIDAAHGYLPELVIKGDRTIPEYGGGLCQIGTTTFRAVLAAGLPITQRRNHSYRVGYYEPPVGMDATIYDPAPDFRFRNDTGHYILFIARTENDQVIFEFYGTRDGRVASTTQPVVYNIVKPGEPRYIETDSLAPGEKKKVESAHNGASASFTYTVTYPDGTVKEEVFNSQYVAWKETWLVGMAASSTEPVAELIVEPSLPAAQ